MSRAFLSAAVLCSVFAIAGCEEAPTAPTEEVAVVTDSFSDTLTVNGAVTHPFVVGTPTTVTATLTTLSTGTDVQVGFLLGTWNLTTESCALVITKDNAVQGSVLIGTAQTSGAFCVRIYDVGKLTAPISYELTVTHQ